MTAFNSASSFRRAPQQGQETSKSIAQFYRRSHAPRPRSRERARSAGSGGRSRLSAAAVAARPAAERVKDESPLVHDLVEPRSRREESPRSNRAEEPCAAGAQRGAGDEAGGRGPPRPLAEPPAGGVAASLAPRGATCYVQSPVFRAITGAPSSIVRIARVLSATA